MIGNELIAQRRVIRPSGSTAPEGDPIVALTPEEEDTETLARLPVGQSVVITGGLPRIRAFFPDPTWDAGREGTLVVALNSEWRFEVYGSRGTLERIISRPFQRRDVRRDHRMAFIDALRAMYERQGLPDEVIDEVVAGVGFSDDLPAFASLAVGTYGSLWVQKLLSDEQIGVRGMTVSVEGLGSREWSAFDATGRYLGDVGFTERFRPVRAVGDRFYGISRDELDIQRVAVYRVASG